MSDLEQTVIYTPLLRLSPEDLTPAWLLPVEDLAKVNHGLQVTAMYGIKVEHQEVGHFLVVEPCGSRPDVDVRVVGLCSRGSPFFSGFMFYQVRQWMRTFDITGRLYADVPYHAQTFQMLLLSNLVPVKAEEALAKGLVRFVYSDDMEKRGVISRMEDDAGGVRLDGDPKPAPEPGPEDDPEMN